jgi:hypothetical protein
VRRARTMRLWRSREITVSTVARGRAKSIKPVHLCRLSEHASPTDAKSVTCATRTLRRIART